jgi:phenylpropionate dioxygenase-like ring-hydroxylating dioxygenase large terminal subunit
MAVSDDRATRSRAFDGYHRKQTAAPDLQLTQVGRGTPGGELLRRFWQPVAYLEELTDVPLRVRALGEDLVAFRDRSGHAGVLHLHCCHRNTSLEFGLIEEHGLRCCYHGRLFDVDGTVLEMPGEPAFERMRNTVSQGAYPTHEFGGILFVYMGPPDRVPVFPVWDRMTIPGNRLVPSIRWPVDCNYVQVVENALDPQHTAVLHVIPQLRGMDHFGYTFGNHPYLTWTDSNAGIIYLAARHVDDNVWVRSAEVVAPNSGFINSVFEEGKARKYASDPFMSFWFLPVDDEHTMRFAVSHVTDHEIMPWEKRRELENFGQLPGRPYRETQWIPGDYEVQVSQGPVNVHALEHLGTIDQGVVRFRRYLRTNMERVARGEDPHGFYLAQTDVPSTSCNDCVVDAAEVGGDPDDGAVLLRFAETLPERYRHRPPMAELARLAGNQG